MRTCLLLNRLTSLASHPAVDFVVHPAVRFAVHPVVQYPCARWWRQILPGVARNALWLSLRFQIVEYMLSKDSSHHTVDDSSAHVYEIYL